jgi:hypothetical protein
MGGLILQVANSCVGFVSRMQHCNLAGIPVLPMIMRIFLQHLTVIWAVSFNSVEQ